MRRSAFVLGVALLAACNDSRERGTDTVQITVQAGCATQPPQPTAGTRVVAAYFSCHSGRPGQLYRAYRVVSDTVDPVEAAIGALVSGPTMAERERGLRSSFGPWTENALLDVQRRGDTVHIDFARFPPAILDDPGATSFLPPGLMGDITWTVFRQFPDVAAIRLSFDGSEQAFWSWLGGPVRAFTRRDWERV